MIRTQLTGRSAKAQRPHGHHLNFGITGTLMRGGGGAATLAAFPTPLGSVLLNAPLSAPAFGRPPPRFPVAVAPPPGAPPPTAPPLRANEAAGMAKTMNNAIATFTEVFDIGEAPFIRRPLECVEADGRSAIHRHH